jgi:hypothetical protein
MTVMARRSARAFTVSVFLAVVAALVPLSAAAGATRATATGTETCSPQSPGTTTVLPSGRVLIRDAVSVCQETSDDPRFNGTNTVTFSANLDASGNGPIGGTYSLATAEGGRWVGTWRGTLGPTGLSFKGRARGEGAYAGLLSFVEGDRGQWTVTLLNPSGA